MLPHLIAWPKLMSSSMIIHMIARQLVTAQVPQGLPCQAHVHAGKEYIITQSSVLSGRLQAPQQVLYLHLLVEGHDPRPIQLCHHLRLYLVVQLCAIAAPLTPASAQLPGEVVSLESALE